MCETTRKVQTNRMSVRTVRIRVSQPALYPLRLAHRGRGLRSQIAKLDLLTASQLLYPLSYGRVSVLKENTMLGLS